MIEMILHTLHAALWGIFAFLIAREVGLRA
jgi:hypothetical protein